MLLEIDCSWNQKKNFGKLLITFFHEPKPVFNAPEEVISEAVSTMYQLQSLGKDALKTLLDLHKTFPESIFLHYAYYEALLFFQEEKKSSSLLKKMNKNFPKEPFTQVLLAHKALTKNPENPKMPFDGNEVLLTAFPKRLLFFYQEATAFHQVWLQYFSLVEDRKKMETHQRFMHLIFRTKESMSLV